MKYTPEEKQNENCPDSPEEWGDDNLFLVGYHRDFWVGNKKISQGLAQSIANKGKYEDDSTCSEATSYLKKYHIFGLEAYIHSGVRLAISQEGNFCDRQWDVSQLGLVFVAKAEARTRKKALTMARGLINTWNDYLSGNVYVYNIEEKTTGECLDSLGGMYGDYETYCLPEALVAAKGLNQEIAQRNKAVKCAVIQAGA